jgi:hypothetical protein
MANIIARLVGSEDWNDYGDVAFYHAARCEAIKASNGMYGHPEYVWHIEVQDRFDDTVPACVVPVKTSIVAEVLEPRQGAE